MSAVTGVLCPNCGTTINVPIDVTFAPLGDDRQEMICTPDMSDLWAHAWACADDPQPRHQQVPEDAIIYQPQHWSPSAALKWVGEQEHLRREAERELNRRNQQPDQSDGGDQ